MQPIVVNSVIGNSECLWKGSYTDEVAPIFFSSFPICSCFRSELLRQKQRSQELEIQLETDHEKILEVSSYYWFQDLPTGKNVIF